jgi:hypothetical protein
LPEGAYEMTVHKSTGSPVTMLVAVMAPSTGMREVICLDKCPMLPDTPSSSSWNIAGSGTAPSSQTGTPSEEIFAQVSNGELVANAALGPLALAGQTNSDGSLSGQITGPTTSLYPSPLSVSLVPHNLTLAPGNYRLDGGSGQLRENGKAVNVDFNRLLGVVSVSGNSTTLQISPTPLTGAALRGQLSGSASAGLLKFTSNSISSSLGTMHGRWLLAVTASGAVMRDAQFRFWQLTYLGMPGQFTWAPGAYTVDDGSALPPGSTAPLQVLAVTAVDSQTLALVPPNQQQSGVKVQGNQFASLSSVGVSGVLTGNNQVVGIQGSEEAGTHNITYRGVVIQPMTTHYLLPAGNYQLELASGSQAATVTADSAGLITIKTSDKQWSGCTLASNVLQCGTAIIGVLTGKGKLEGSWDYESPLPAHSKDPSAPGPHFARLLPTSSSNSGNTDTSSAIAGSDSGNTPAASAGGSSRSMASRPDVSTPVVSPPSPTMAKPADEIDIPATKSQ